jgi:hypothetical protein
MKLCLVPLYLLQPASHFAAGPIAMSIFKSTQHAEYLSNFVQIFQTHRVTCLVEPESERYFVEHIPLYRKPAFLIAIMPRKK